MNLSPTTGRCVQHCPERAAERAAMQSAGGAAAKVAKRQAKAADTSAVPPRMRTLGDAVSVAAWIVDSVLRGAIDARTAEAATKSVRQFQLGEEKRALQDRVRELERRLKEREAR
jgi:hypothetical protein